MGATKRIFEDMRDRDAEELDMQQLQLIHEMREDEMIDCPENCYAGRHYNNADEESGQYVTCLTCKGEGEIKKTI